MTEEEFRKILAGEGFDEIAPVTYEHGERGTHEHTFQVKALVVKGDFEIETEGKSTRYGVGDIFELRPNQPHSERYGTSGVSYVVGRKHT